MASPSEAKNGEVVSLQAEPEGEAVSICYTLRLNGRVLFAGEEDTHFEAAFRPRGEGEYTVQASIRYQDGREENASAKVTVSGTAEIQQGSEVIYSQKDGWWENKKYSVSNLEKAGCAIFTLSHALQRMGRIGEDVLPEKLAGTYAGCYTEGGTANARLITRASEVYGYSTGKDLISSRDQIREALKEGDFFSFSIVNGHIALISGIDETSDKVRIIDSAPGATFERIRDAKIYYSEDGTFQEASEPAEIPGAKYYFETADWGGLEYYMDLNYVSRRGVRLIRPPWLTLQTESGRTGVRASVIGTAICVVNINGKEQEVPTADVSWSPDGEESILAVVSKKTGSKLMNRNGKRVATVPPCTILPVLREETDQVYVIYQNDRGYISRKDVELTAPQEAVRTGLISLNGYINGRAKVKVRFGGAAKEKVIAEWKTGTRVAVTGKERDYYQVEAKGLSVWIQEAYLILEE